MKLFLLTIILMVIGCSQPPIDPSSPELNNHYRIEMIIDNVTNIGLAGISYKDRSELEDKILVLPPIYKGSLELFSERCGKSFSIAYEENDVVSIPIIDLLSDYDSKCSYRIIRRIIGTNHIMVGYFYINYYKENLFPLKIEVNDTFYNGVVPFQIREGDLIPIDFTSYNHVKDNIILNDTIAIKESKIIKIYPRGTKGKLMITGCNASFVPVEFTSTPIVVDFASIFSSVTVENSCDYEIGITNYDVPEFETATLITNVYKKETQWLETPFINLISDNKVKVYFINPYIVGLSIDNKICKNSHHCVAKCKKDTECIVRAVTTSGRFFWGTIKNGKFTRIK
jgi:hypothetical protein